MYIKESFRIVPYENGLSGITLIIIIHGFELLIESAVYNRYTHIVSQRPKLTILMKAVWIN